MTQSRNGQRGMHQLFAALAGTGALVVGGCDYFKKEGVGEIIGLRFGTKMDQKIKEGPREPPIFQGDLREFYEIEFPNLEFDFVGVAVTKNSPEVEKEGIRFDREKIIWGAMLNKKGKCDLALYDKTIAYLGKKWSTDVIKETLGSQSSFYKEAFLFSPGVLWSVSCSEGSGLSLVVKDYSVLKSEANAEGRKVIEAALKEIRDISKRKMQ